MNVLIDETGGIQMLMKLSASIGFQPTEAPENLQLRPSGRNKQWRYLANNCAVELVPVCDREAGLVHEPLSSSDRLKIWPVQWGYPDSLVSEHPDEVDRMRRDHFAGEHELIDGSHTWQHWLDHFGKAELWHKFSTPEMEECWLNWQTGNGFTLFLYSKKSGTLPLVQNTVSEDFLTNIKFRADFFRGCECQTIYLSGCFRTPLTQAEISNRPEHLEEQKQLTEKQVVLETISAENIKSQQSLVTQKMILAKVQGDNRRKDEQAKRERARQPVSKQEVLTALGVKTERGARIIFKRYEFEGWPTTQEQLGSIFKMHQRRKKTLAEALGKRNKERAAKR